MSEPPAELERAAGLRERARARGPEARRAAGALPGAYRAFEVLHNLAMSPATAADALALLHELQVHQVELDLQQEDLRSSRVVLEQASARQRQLYDAAPVACFTIERDTALVELNLTAARLLGQARDALPGRRLDSYLNGPSAPALHALLARAAAAAPDAACAVELVLSGATPRRVVASASVDPAGERYLIAFTDLGALLPAVGR